MVKNPGRGGGLVTDDWIILFEEKKHNDGLTDMFLMAALDLFLYVKIDMEKMV